MEKPIKKLPIFDMNSDSYPRAKSPYPIQPYPMGINDGAGLPSAPYQHIVACYHQVRTYVDGDPRIFPSKGCGIVCVIGENNAGSFLVGAPTLPRKAEYLYPNCECFVAIFWPETGYGLFSDYISAAVDTHIPLEKIFPDAASCFTEKMVSAENMHHRIKVFEMFLDRILASYCPIPVRHRRLLSRIADFPDPSSCGACGRLIPAEFSSRHVQRLCSRYLGITPKLFARINRYQKTLHVMNINPGVNLSDLAIKMGYFDQAHFIKEFKKFQDMTPLEFLSQFTCR